MIQREISRLSSRHLVLAKFFRQLSRAFFTFVLSPTRAVPNARSDWTSTSRVRACGKPRLGRPSGRFSVTVRTGHSAGVRSSPLHVPRGLGRGGAAAATVPQAGKRWKMSNPTAVTEPLSSGEAERVGRRRAWRGCGGRSAEKFRLPQGSSPFQASRPPSAVVGLGPQVLLLDVLSISNRLSGGAARSRGALWGERVLGHDKRGGDRYLVDIPGNSLGASGESGSPLWRRKAGLWPSLRAPGEWRRCRPGASWSSAGRETETR